MPTFFGIPLCPKLLNIKWEYSERNTKKEILLQYIQFEDWEREKDTILKWIEESRRYVGKSNKTYV